MKKLKILTLFISAMLTLACSNDDGNSKIEASIVGNWKAEKFEVDGNAKSNGITVPLSGMVYDNTYALKFSESPNIVIPSGDFSIELTADFLGQTYTENVEDIQFDGNGTWSIEGENLLIPTSEGVDVFEIKLLTATTLRLLHQFEEPVDFDGNSGTVTINVDLTFTRQ